MKALTRLKFACLRQTAVIEDIDLRSARGIDRAFFAKLVDGDWISRKQNLLITGATKSNSYCPPRYAAKSHLILTRVVRRRPPSAAGPRRA